MSGWPGPTTRHGELAELLRREIEEGIHPVGSQFVREAELQERFGVGRHTVREALKLLSEYGLLGRRRRTGTVVLTDRPVAHYVHSLRDLKGLMDFAQNTRFEIRYEGVVTMSDRVLSKFTGLEDKRWFRVAGVRFTRADGNPLCWSEVLVPERFALARTAIREDSQAIYERVLEQNGLKLDYVEQDVSASVLRPKLAAMLNAETETAALAVRRRYMAHTGDTFEISYNLYPATRYSVRNVIRRRM